MCAPAAPALLLVLSKPDPLTLGSGLAYPLTEVSAYD